MGEDNPHDADPRLALYPAPSGGAGSRLCQILGVSRAGLAATWRANLCVSRWTRAAAEIRADELLEGPWSGYLLLGTRVAAAFRQAIGRARVRADRADIQAFKMTRAYRAGTIRVWERGGTVVVDPNTHPFKDANVHSVTMDVANDDGTRRATFLCVPHPSGRCRKYNDASLAPLVRAAFKALTDAPLVEPRLTQVVASDAC